jgi:putative ABC transport system ATP-binding protein
MDSDPAYSIVLRGVSKEYRRDTFRIPVLEDLDLTVQEGEFLALMGPSGSGKTTLLNLIAGLDRATEGSVVVHDHELTEMSESELTRWRANNVGFVFQMYNLIPVMTAIARAIVTDPYLIVADEPTGDLDRKSADEILGQLGVLNREFRKTIVMVTHDPIAAQHASRILHLDKGKLVGDIIQPRIGAAS